MTMSIKNLLLWDFDGVIIDSIDECLLTSYNAFLKYQNLSGEFIWVLNDILISYRKEFYRTRKYVRLAGEYYILHKAITNNISIDSYSTFKKLLRDNAEAVADFQNLFFSIRNKFRSNFPQYWLELHRPYPEIISQWYNLKKYFDFYIVSNKDSKSISLILGNIGLSIRKNNMLGADFSSSKRKIIEHILSTTNITANRVFFIDDNYQHLLDLSDMGIKLFFACWGYGEIPDKPNGNIISLNLDNFNFEILKEFNGKVCKN